MVTDLGAALTGITVVTLYDTLGFESIDYIIDQTKLETVVVSADKITNLV
jgi:long-chain acyl-CoA synthetase